MGIVKYRMSDPGYTIYHRVGLCGLAATVRTLINDAAVPAPYRIDVQGRDQCTVSRDGKFVQMVQKDDYVELLWDGDTSYADAMDILLKVSFHLTDDNIIFMPGKGIKFGDTAAVIAEHTGCLKTFLSVKKKADCPKHPDQQVKKADGTTKTEKGRRIFKPVVVKRDDKEIRLSYAVVLGYAHRELPKQIHNGPDAKEKIKQHLIPGADAGPHGCFLDTVANEILLRYTMVASRIFDIRFKDDPKKLGSYPKSQYYCVLMPDPENLKRFIRHFVRSRAVVKYNSRFEAHCAAGVEEAMLRFGVDMRMADQNESVPMECLAVAIRPGAKDPMRRLFSRSCRLDYNLEMFETAVKHFGDPFFSDKAKDDKEAQQKAAKDDDDEEGSEEDGMTPIYMPELPIPEWLAGNLVNNRHWCYGFATLPGIVYNPTADKKAEFRHNHQRKGFTAMKNEIRDEQETAYIRLVQYAWRTRMAVLLDKNGGKELNEGQVSRLLGVEGEQINNEINRRKSYPLLREWINRFLSQNRSPDGASLASQCQEFIFEPRNFHRLRDLTLFALMSYEKGKVGDKSDKKQLTTASA